MFPRLTALIGGNLFCLEFYLEVSRAVKLVVHAWHLLALTSETCTRPHHAAIQLPLTA